MNSTTYRPNYFGGIWQIDEDKFLQTKSNPILSDLRSDIAGHFFVPWNFVQWQNLTKPLYSGLAAALYLAVVELGEAMPRSREDQAAFYNKYFRPNDRNAAHNFVVQTGNLEAVCSRSNLDLVFVVDSSSSISPADFDRAKRFANNVVDRFTIGPDDVRVAFLTFSTGFQLQFFLNQYAEKAAVTAAIDQVLKKEGATDTDLALEYVANEVFSSTNGARPGVSKVVLLLTDGQSPHEQEVREAAANLRDKGAVIFAIGVGDQLNVNQLGDIASSPNCTHVIVLSQYSDLDTLIDTMQQVSCKAPTVLPPGSYSYPCTQDNIFQVPVNGTAITIVDVTDGAVDVYGSFSSPNPSKAFSEFSISPAPGQPGVVFLNQENRPLFLNVAPSTCTKSYTIKVQGQGEIPANGRFVCIENGLASACSSLDILKKLYSVKQSPNLGFPSPCTPGQAGYYVYPNGNDRFIYCDGSGGIFVVFCPPHTHFDPSPRFCVPGDPSTASPVTPPPVVMTSPQPTSMGGNPCTKDNIQNNLFFFPYPPDETKYVKCTEWPPTGYIMNCPPHRIWDQADLTCVFRDVVLDPGQQKFDLKTNNPCKPNTDTFYFTYPPDKNKFIQCDDHGDAFVKTCLLGEVWNQDLLQCMPSEIVNGPGLMVGK